MDGGMCRLPLGNLVRAAPNLIVFTNPHPTHIVDPALLLVREEADLTFRATELSTYVRP